MPALKNIPIQLTDSALKELQRIVVSENIDVQTRHLRIGVKGGGCAGLSYIFDFEPSASFSSENDFFISHNGINIVIAQEQIVYLEGIEIDFARGLNNKGFTFNNPKAETTCGCGTSFSA